MTPPTTEPIAQYLERFGAFEQALNGEADTPLHHFRVAAMQRAAAIGFPTQRHEEWRYTNLTPITGTAFDPAAIPCADGIPADALARFSFIGESDPLLVFLDGRLVADASRTLRNADGARASGMRFSLDEGVTSIVETLDSIDAGERGFFPALNSAFVQDGAVVHVPDGATIDTPVYLVFFSSGDGVPRMSAPRIVVQAGRGSAATVVEVYASLGTHPAFTNAVTEISAGENAAVEHLRIQVENNATRHTGGTFVRQQRDSSVTTRLFTLGGSLTRNDLSTVLDGENCEAVLDGLALARNDMHVDNHTRIVHAQPHSRSFERYKNVVDDNARTVFSGRIVVRPGAQKTDAKQSNNTLLLSDAAMSDSKPQLEIFADDVKCTHGATVGRIREDALFYLRSRGIGSDEARALLTYAFASELLDGITNDTLREWIQTAIHERLLQNS